MAANQATGRWVLNVLAAGTALSVDVVTGSDGIGALTTFFRNIGAAVSSARIGRPRFSVRQAVGLFELSDYRHDRAVTAMRRKVLSYKSLFARPESRPIVTLVQFNDALVVLDGNHTTMAAYLYALDHPTTPYALSVFVLSAPDSIEVLG